MSFAQYWNEPNEKKVYRTECTQCDWSDDLVFSHLDECTIDTCPSCGSQDIRDEVEYV